MTGPRVVAIDGPAGSGKSTLARRLASALDLPYVNTGLMYRALTLEALRRGVDLDDGERLKRLAGTLTFDLSSGTTPAVLRVGGRVPSDALTRPDVEAAVSRVARHSAVRELMLAEQRRLGEGGAVMEGRDIGSVVFPDAPAKIFLSAHPSERARRRIVERGAGDEADRVAELLARRDARDATVNPFVPAPDAVLIDTSGRGADDVFEEALAIARERLGSARA